MNREAFEELLSVEPKETAIQAHSLIGPDRTLLLGYNCSRETWHVYLKDGLIHRYVYRVEGANPDPILYESWGNAPVDRLIPDKRVYPESTDVVFALRLRRMGVPVPYLMSFNDERWARVQHMVFHGRIAE